MKPFLIKIPLDLHTQIKVLAAERGETMMQLIIKLLRKALEK